MVNGDQNYWNEFEYDKLKLLLHREKVQSLIDVSNGIKRYDNLPPISVEMHLTDKCNLSCPWCTDRDLHKIGAVMQTDLAIKCMNEFGHMRTGVTIEGGGEPTLHPEFEKIVNYGFENHVNLGLITNGTVNISDLVNKFRWIRISLDSSNKKEYKHEKGFDLFDKVLSNIESYQKYRDAEKCYLGIGYVITKHNVSNIRDIITILNELGVDYIYFRPVEEAPAIVPSREELYDLRKDILDITDGMRIKFIMNINDRLEYDNVGLPCVAHSITSIIHADGNVACCEKRRQDEICFGNIQQNSFEEIWNSQLRKEITEKLLDSKCQMGCQVCRITPFNKIINNLNNLNTKEFI